MLASLPRINSPLAKCGCKKHAMDFFTATSDYTSTCAAQSEPPRRTMVRLCSALSSGRMHAWSAPRMESRQARANSAATWRFGTTYETKLAAGAWSSTSASPMSTLAQVATCNQMGCSRIRRTSMPLCILLRRREINSYRQQYASRQSEHFLHPRHSQHLHPHARRPLAAFFSTGPPGDRAVVSDIFSNTVFEESSVQNPAGPRAFRVRRCPDKTLVQKKQKRNTYSHIQQPRISAGRKQHCSILLVLRCLQREQGALPKILGIQVASVCR